jgi:hypothetical protein
MPDTYSEIEASIASVDYGSLAALTASALGDPSYATWTLDQLKEWVLEAARDYGAHFQRVASTTITCTTGTREYALPTDASWVQRVEHPTGRVPPAYLTRYNRNKTDFTDTDDRFDWSIDGTQGAGTAKVWISRTPAAGDYIDVLYTGYWWSPSGTSYVLRMREPHYPLLIKYAAWRAYHERWTHALLESLTIHYDEVIDPEFPGVTRDAYTFATDRAARWHEAAQLARQTYDEALALAKAELAVSNLARWEMSGVDVIY